MVGLKAFLRMWLLGLISVLLSQCLGITVWNLEATVGIYWGEEEAAPPVNCHAKFACRNCVRWCVCVFVYLSIALLYTNTT